MMNQKPKGVGVMIAVGPKEPPRLGAPGAPKAPASAPTPDHEAAETPEYEQSEDYGAKLLNDMVSPLTDLGLGEDDAKATLAQIFQAAAKCLTGGGSPVAEHDAGGQSFEGSEEYGR